MSCDLEWKSVVIRQASNAASIDIAFFNFYEFLVDNSSRKSIVKETKQSIIILANKNEGIDKRTNKTQKGKFNIKEDKGQKAGKKEKHDKMCERTERNNE